MFNFENRSPTKQGTKYSMFLGQNDGPFLIKDMVITNKKTLQSLTGNPVALSTAQNILKNDLRTPGKGMDGSLKAHPVYDSQLKSYTNYDEKKKTGLVTAENILATTGFQNQQLHEAQESLKQYKTLVGEYKQELKDVQSRISGEPFDDLRALQIQMRQMHSMMREHSDFVRNQNYQVQRDIDTLGRDKHGLVQQLGFYGRKLEDLEKVIGVSGKIEEPSETGSNYDDD